MTNRHKYIVAVIPSWFDEQHHSHVRMERYLRWSKKAGLNVSIICSGNEDKIEKFNFGQIFYFEDILGYFREDRNTNNIQFRNIKRLIRFVFKKLWIPDNGIIWVLRIYLNSKVRKIISESDYLISTSPPESSHIGTYLLAKKYNKKLIIDLRDGWLDDPLRENIRGQSIRRKIEKYIENKILKYSFRIFVSSKTWKDLLNARYKHYKYKIFVLTNTYSIDYKKVSSETKNFKNEKLNILYLGRLTASRSTQKIEYLLEPILKYSKATNRNFNIKFVGKLVQEDFDGIDSISENYGNINDIIVQDPIEKSQINDELNRANGLLLLCISKASIPSKFYDYIPTLKPILVVTPKYSAIWNICENISQVSLIDSHNMNNSNDVLEEFWNNMIRNDNIFDVPDIFSEDYVSRQYLDAISINNN